MEQGTDAVGGFLPQQEQFKMNQLTQCDSVDCSAPDQAFSLTIKRNNYLTAWVFLGQQL